MAKINVKQHDITDCGAACLASICLHYKLSLPISKIRQYASTDIIGTNVLGLVEAAKKIGFDVKGVKGDLPSLFKIPLPSIAHIVTKDNLQHYVVIYKINKTHVTIMDPGDGKLHKKEHKEFESEWTGVLVLLIPSESFSEGNEKTSIYQRFWLLIKPHKFILIQAFFGAIIYTLLGFSTSIFIQKLTDYVLVGGNTKLLNLMGVIMITLLTLQLIVGIFKDVFIIKTGQQIDGRLILGYYKYLLKLPQNFFDSMRIGEIISRVNDAVKIRVLINDGALSIVVNVLILVFSFSLMFFYYWKLALIMTLILPLYLIIYLITNNLNKTTERKVMENSAKLESQLVESLSSIATIKRFGLENFANIKTEISFVDVLKKTYNSSLNSVFSINTSNFISQIFTVLLLWIGAYYVIEREITAGELMSFYAIIGYLTKPVSSLIESNKQIQNAIIASDRLFEIMDLESEKNENKILFKREKVGDIKFDNIFFRYGSRVDVFKGFHLTISKGKLTSIIGESGSGKTTLMALLQNIYPIHNGSITIGNLNIKHLNNESLRDLVSVVPQKIDLFSGSVLENIAVGVYLPNKERVITICREIGILDFIENLPDGFDTYLGEHGASLSGGQRQRVAIARALYKNPEILILDEATSSLDSTSESYIQKTIMSLKEKGKTIIVIAHRLSTVINSDMIIVLEKGQVIEKGNHSDLYNRQGKYYDYWQEQIPKI